MREVRSLRPGPPRWRGHRLWYVAALPLADYQPSYAALLADGWRPLTTLTASGCSATLLVHG